ncbi:hypothetical protein SALBM311S_04961 [Streptomyces alboniger]
MSTLRTSGWRSASRAASPCAAEDQHARVGAVHRGLDQRLVVTVLVPAADPEPAVEEEADGPAVGAAGEDDLRDVRLHRHPYVVAVDRLSCGPFESRRRVRRPWRAGRARRGWRPEQQRAGRGSRRNRPRTSTAPATALTVPVSRAPVSWRQEAAAAGGAGQAADEGPRVVRGEPVGGPRRPRCWRRVRWTSPLGGGLGAVSRTTARAAATRRAAGPTGRRQAGPGERRVPGHRAPPAGRRPQARNAPTSASAGVSRRRCR